MHLSHLLCFVCWFVFATSHCSACGPITSAWCGEACGVLICSNIPAGVCFLLVCELLHTPTKLTLFCHSIFVMSLFLFVFSILLSFFLTPVFSIYQFAALSCLSHLVSALVEPLNLSPFITMLATWELECFARMFTHISDKLSGLISESRPVIRIVYLIQCLGKEIYHYFCVIKTDSHGSAFQLYSVPKCLCSSPAQFMVVGL